MVSVMLYPYMVCAALSMDMFVLCVVCLTVFVNCPVKQLAICLAVDVILLMNAMELSSKECMCCACDPSVRLDTPPYFVCAFVCQKLSPHLRV